MDVDANSQGSQYTEVCIALRMHSSILTKFTSCIGGVCDVNQNYSNVTKHNPVSADAHYKM